jgi:pimeloyl-ACP methyl ester carboxylesterase
MLSVKRILRKPNLKFNILAHSMGGLIARYAAMYGSADLPRNGAVPVPTWAGAAHINKLMMFGTPNEGAFSSFDALINGYPIVADRKLPLIDDLRPEDVLTSPAAFQLLPHEPFARFLDENLQPIKIDIYDPATWIKYGWGAITDPRFLAKLKDGDKSDLKSKDLKRIADPKRQYYDDVLLSHTTSAQVRAFFASALARAKAFQLALDAPSKNVPVQFYTYGGNCEPTLNAVVLLHDDKKNEWTTLVDAREIKNSSGKTLKKDEVKAAMFAIGDGRVTARSLLPTSETEKAADGSPMTAIFPVASSLFGCSSHFKLFLDKPIQDSFLSALVVGSRQQP